MKTWLRWWSFDSFWVEINLIPKLRIAARNWSFQEKLPKILSESSIESAPKTDSTELERSLSLQEKLPKILLESMIELAPKKTESTVLVQLWHITQCLMHSWVMLEWWLAVELWLAYSVEWLEALVGSLECEMVGEGGV